MIIFQVEESSAVQFLSISGLYICSVCKAIWKCVILMGCFHIIFLHMIPVDFSPI